MILKKIISGIVVLSMFFFSCEKDQSIVTTSASTENLLTGLYFGKYSTSASAGGAGSTNHIDSVYAIVDTIGTDIYRFKICDDSLLLGTLHETFEIDLQNQPLTPCNTSPPTSYYNSFPSGVVNMVELVVYDCDSISISRQYKQISSHSGTSSGFQGMKLH